MEFVLHVMGALLIALGIMDILNLLSLFFTLATSILLSAY